MKPEQIQSIMAYLSHIESILALPTPEPYENISDIIQTVNKTKAYVRLQCPHDTIDLGDAEHQDIQCVICGGKDKSVAETHKKILEDIPY